MRAFWTGSIVLGLVRIPVKLYSAVRDTAPKFHQLHKPCSTRISSVRRCETCGVDVAWEDVVKGHEVSPGAYVAFTAEELAGDAGEDRSGRRPAGAAGDAGEDRTIPVLRSMPIGKIPPEYVDTTYWLGPTPAGARAYRMLAEELSTSERDLLGTVKLRTRPRLCFVHASDDSTLLSLSTLRYAEEIVDGAELEPEVNLKHMTTPKEMKLLHELLKRYEPGLDFRAYADAHAEALQKAVDGKLQRGEVLVSPGGKAVSGDLGGLLEASLDAKERM
jgi:DNA end-binding protein Ku